MKTKSFQKKLSLVKQTVSDLNSKEMNHAHGGGETITRACWSCVVTCATQCEFCTDLCPDPTDIC